MTTATVPPRLSLRQILHPRSAAVFGASEDKGKFGGRIIHYLHRHGFAGRILPINPRREEILGLPCYREIGEAPGPIDVAILAVPAAAIMDSVAACAAAEVGCCVIITTGFAEAGEDGLAAQRRIVETARQAGMRIIGPNCMGLMNLHNNFLLTSSLVLEVDHLHRGGIGLVSQSGALMVSMFNRAHDAGIGFSSCVSLGNQSDIMIEDVLEYMVEDPATRIITLYVEGLLDAPRFLALARRARAAGKPVLMVKTGRTAGGVKAARSHTASLAGSYAVLAAACREAGVVLTDDPDAMVALAALLERWGPLPADGIGLLSSSGGGCGIAVDRLEEAGLQLAGIGDATRQALLTHLIPPQADNPIDLGGRRAGDSVAIAGEVLSILSADPAVAIQFVVLTTVPFYAETARALGAAALAAGKPVVLTITPGSAADPPRQQLRALGCPYFDRMDDAVRVLRLYIEHGRMARESVPPTPQRPAGLPATVTLHPGPMTEPEVKALLAGYGIAVTREILARSVEEAIEAAEAIGFPVAMKGVSRALVHKSDVGGVILGVAAPQELFRAWRDIEVNLELAHIRPLEGCLVQEMVAGGIELIIGAKRDPQFGPVLLVGMGGVLVELLGDVQLALPPIAPETALTLLRRLRLWPLLDGYRGRAKPDLAAIAQAVSRVSWLAADLGDRLIELDINPLMVCPVRGVIAVDARATMGATLGPPAADGTAPSS
jgi:acetyl-CoA synthetase (ADP-forming)